MIDKRLLLNLPEEPGVYLMKDKKNKIIYVGKAKILKNRVKQYFLNIEKHTPKVKAMVINVASFEYIITDSELEALILECNLIKKYKPYYNILLKDDKNFPYIKVSINEDYPKIFLTRRMEKDGAKYFGPYTNSAAVRDAIDLVRKIFRLPDCSIKLPEDMGKKRECLNSHIDLCIAPCINTVSKYEYKRLISRACEFLEGDHDELLGELAQKMLGASEALEFERAATLRDKITSIKQVDERQKIISEKQADEDIIALYKQDSKTFISVFFIRNGRLLGRHIEVLDKTEDMPEASVITEFLKLFYQEAAYIPKNIYTEFEIEDYELINKWLCGKTGKNINLKCPKRGDKVRLVDLCRKNARQAAVDYILKKSDTKKTIKKTILNMKDELKLSKLPYRIEAYDISNTQGSDSVGSMVVFINGEPVKKHYRRFKIETVEGSDDYKSMTEVIYRRLRHAVEEEKQINNGTLSKENAKFLPLPDCIFLDGGKGHISVISDLFELTDTDIPLFGMVKDDKHRTNMLINEKNEEISFKRQSEEFKLIAKIQDEVHRYAIEYHRLLRKKTMTGSVLLEIDGIGDKSRIALMKHFKTLNAIKAATAEELMQAEKITKKQAENVYKFFHGIT